AQEENVRLTTALVELATVDPLTGLSNRRSFFELAEREWTRTTRSGAPLTAVMLDVDHFKHINDRCGHAAGDEVLIAVARRCQQELRSVDVLGRYGAMSWSSCYPTAPWSTQSPSPSGCAPPSLRSR